MCNCIHELLNVFEDSAQHEHTIVESKTRHSQFVSIFQQLASYNACTTNKMIASPQGIMISSSGNKLNH